MFLSLSSKRKKIIWAEPEMGKEKGLGLKIRMAYQSDLVRGWDGLISRREGDNT